LHEFGEALEVNPRIGSISARPVSMPIILSPERAKNECKMSGYTPGTFEKPPYFVWHLRLKSLFFSGFENSYTINFNKFDKIKKDEEIKLLDRIFIVAPIQKE
jgi:hypothetical protein